MRLFAPTRFRTMRLRTIGALVCLLSAAAQAEDFAYLDPAGHPGALLVAAGMPADTVREKFATWANGRERVVIDLHERALPMGAELECLENVLWYSGEFSDQGREKVAEALSRQRDHVAIWLEEKAAIAISGRDVRSLGTGGIHVLLAASAGRELWRARLETGERHDLVMLCRAAMERARGDFPSIAPPPCAVESGSLVIAGGGSLPRDVVQTFLDLAGGYEAPIVVLPIAAGDSLSGDMSNDTRLFTRVGASNVSSFRGRTLAEVSESEFANALREAKGVWFGGGRQWRFIDAYFGTPAHELLRDVLRRGGVIGGSSAGASIQGYYMPRGSPLGNTDMMAEGYERGLGFLPGAAIDQHFSARRRHDDMSRLMTRYPQLLGIGVDEGTALVVRGSTGRVIGRGSVHFYDYRTGIPSGERDYVTCGAGQSFDLEMRQPRD